MPKPKPKQVEALAQRLGVDLSMWVSLTDEDGMAPFPCPCSLRDAFTRYLNPKP
jgi:hypothetical protein